MGRARERRLRVGRIFESGVIVRLKELREGDEFVTLATGFDGYVVERHSDGVIVDLIRGEEHVTRRVHPFVRVAVA